MTSPRVRRALDAATDTKTLLVADDAIDRTAKVFKTHFGDQLPVVVTDETSFRVLGDLVNQNLTASGLNTLSPFVFPQTPRLHPDYERVTELAEFLKGNHAIPVAVGSGTINDITKLASYEAGRQYMVVGTAASVDGYCSYGAAISRGGLKRTLACPGPVAVVADTRVLRDAPPKMTAAGYGDLAAKLTSGADWIIADMLGIDSIDPQAWDMVQVDLRKWLGGAKKLSAGDPQAFGNLFEGLTMCGLAMQFMQRARPISGSEHLLNKCMV